MIPSVPTDAETLKGWALAGLDYGGDYMPNSKTHAAAIQAVNDLASLAASLAAVVDEHEQDRETLRDACNASAWEQDHGGCDCRACTVLMDAVLAALSRPVPGEDAS